MSIENPTLSAAADFAHVRHFIRRDGFSSLLTNFPSTTVEIALQIHSILTNKPNFPHFSPKNDDFTKNKPNSKPIQTQFDERPKLMQSLYSQGIMKENADMGQKKQTQFKPNQSQFEFVSDFKFMRNTLEFTLDVSSLALEFILGCVYLLVCRGVGEETNLKVVIEVFRPAVITVVDCLIFFYLSINPDSLDMLGSFCITVNRRQNCTDFHITSRYFKRKR
ncbi:MAG: hypothetical protein JRF06_03190, partial [Deltaproteobacteria bacterium]|nr:hypothetical protein [Deltaproteobacteria bacterium]